MKSLLLSVLIGAIAIILYRDQLQEQLASNPTVRFLATQITAPFANTKPADISTTTTDQLDQQHLYATDMSVPRAISKVFLAVEQAEGAGARVRRSIGTPNLRNFSPFLMLDHFSIKPGAGFPDHPHRGQETVSTGHALSVCKSAQLTQHSRSHIFCQVA